MKTIVKEGLTPGKAPVHPTVSKPASPPKPTGGKGPGVPVVRKPK